MVQEKTDLYKTLASDNEYYRYIFKKTEKIACAVFYILEHKSHTEEKSLIVKDLELTSLKTLDIALQSLRPGAAIPAYTLFELRHALLELESKLRLLHASGELSAGHLDVFLSEIDSARRTLEHYLEFNEANPLAEKSDDTTRQRSAVSRDAAKAQGGSQEEYAVRSKEHTHESPDRRTRILEVLKGVGEASIKDISAVVTDCSEKTIQRELNALIKDNIVQRKGHRRWSKYSVL